MPIIIYLNIIVTGDVHSMKVSPYEFIHPQDKAALENMEAIPGFPTLVKKILAIGYESLYYGTNMASNIRLSSNQLPKIYNHLPPICEKLGIPEPELYLKMDPMPNAFTFGDTKVFITLTSGLVDCMTEEELDAVIAHECGHILCRHVLYHTVAMIIKNCADAMGMLGTLSIPVQLALFYWSRMSELSSDRCAAVITSPEIVASTMARLSGGPKSITQEINYAEWAKQADEYERIRQNNTWSKTLQALAVMDLDHPFSAVRVNEIIKWCQSDEYSAVKRCINNAAQTCPNCGKEIIGDWKFCFNCGTKLK